MSCFKFVSPILALALSLVGESFAVPAYPYPITVKNPDGSEVVVRKVGDEKLHYTVSEEGELVARDSLGFWHYADESGKPTGVRLHKRGERGDVEKRFLEKRNSKDILRKFLKEKKSENEEGGYYICRTVAPQGGSAPCGGAYSNRQRPCRSDAARIFHQHYDGRR